MGYTPFIEKGIIPTMIFSLRLVLKTLVTLISLALCCIQLRTATINLIDPPTVVSIIEKDITEIDLPIVTICQTIQGNKTRLHELEYFRMVDLLNGHKAFKGSVELLSWGQHANLSFDQVLDEVINYEPYTNISVHQDNVDTRKVFLPRYGKCLEISNFNPKKELLITNNVFYPNLPDMNTSLRVFITDKSYQSYYSIDFPSHTRDKIEIQPKKEYYIDVKLSLVSTCNTAAKELMTNNFKECVDDAVNNKFSRNPGCTPPWLSPNNHCNDTIPYPAGVENYNFIPNFHDDYILNVLTLKQSKVETKCRKYCKTLTSEVKIRETADMNTFSIQTGWNNGGDARISFNPKVRVTETSFNYGLFQYVIDVGSSLGLWLGLSVLGLYDLGEVAVDYIMYNVERKQ